MLLEREKTTGKIDYHSRAHLALDLSVAATAANSYTKVPKVK